MRERISLKKWLRNGSMCSQYALDWMLLAIEIRWYQKKTPILLCIANPGSIGGTELQIEIIANTLKTRLGNCLVLISGRLEGGRSNLFIKRLSSLGIAVLRLRSLGVVSYNQWPFLAKATAYLLGKVIKTSKICHFFNPSSTVLAPVVKTLGLANYYMETGMPSSESRWWEMLHTTIGYFNHVTSVSSAGLHRLEFDFGYKGPSSVIPSMFHLPSSHFFCREPVEGVFDLVYFGRMTRNKGIDLLIEAFAHLLNDFPNARLSLIGSGERAPLLKNLVKEFFLSNCVQFIDWVQNDALFSRLVTMDLFCLPSFTEGLPCSILEAMSIGLPIVATDVGGIPEIIEHNVSGILIAPRDVKALTKALLELAGDPFRRMQLRKEGLLRWKRSCTQEFVMNQLMIAYGITSS